MDDREFEQFVLEYQERALRLAESFLGDWSEARDAVQEAFVKAYRHSAGFREQASRGTWFFRILSNHCKDRLRRRRVRSWLTFGLGAADREGEGHDIHYPDPSPSPGQRAESKSFRRFLAAALRELPARQQEVFRLKALAGLTLGETAAALGIAEGTAKVHFFRASRALQEALAPWKDAS